MMQGQKQQQYVVILNETSDWVVEAAFKLEKENSSLLWVSFFIFS